MVPLLLSINLELNKLRLASRIEYNREKLGDLTHNLALLYQRLPETGRYTKVGNILRSVKHK